MRAILAYAKDLLALRALGMFLTGMFVHGMAAPQAKALSSGGGCHCIQVPRKYRKRPQKEKKRKEKKEKQKRGLGITDKLTTGSGASLMGYRRSIPKHPSPSGTSVTFLRVPDTRLRIGQRSEPNGGIANTCMVIVVPHA
jgi:hypothetical protein